MTFTENFFFGCGGDKNIQLIKPLLESKSINYLEIGVFEGQCTQYIAQNICDAFSKISVIDPFEDSKSEVQSSIFQFKQNLQQYLNNITIYKGFSEDIMPKLLKSSFDLIYIDGSHKAKDVYNDAMNAYELLKPGGIIIFDDYLWWLHTLIDNNDNYLNIPLPGINSFISEMEKNIKLLSKPVFLDTLNLTNQSEVMTNEKNMNLLIPSIFNSELYELNYQFIIQKCSA